MTSGKVILLLWNSISSVENGYDNVVFTTVDCWDDLMKYVPSKMFAVQKAANKFP